MVYSVSNHLLCCVGLGKGNADCDVRISNPFRGCISYAAGFSSVGGSLEVMNIFFLWLGLLLFNWMSLNLPEMYEENYAGYGFCGGG